MRSSWNSLVSSGDYDGIKNKLRSIPRWIYGITIQSFIRFSFHLSLFLGDFFYACWFANLLENVSIRFDENLVFFPRTACYWNDIKKRIVNEFTLLTFIFLLIFLWLVNNHISFQIPSGLDSLSIFDVIFGYETSYIFRISSLFAIALIANGTVNGTVIGNVIRCVDDSLVFSDVVKKSCSIFRLVSRLSSLQNQKTLFNFLRLILFKDN